MQFHFYRSYVIPEGNIRSHFEPIDRSIDQSITLFFVAA